jgi:hypothetical protein
MRIAAVLYLVLCALPAAAQPAPEPLAVGRLAEWGGAQVFTHGGMTLSLTIAGPDDVDRMAELVIEKPGLEPARVSDSTTGNGWGLIGIIPFDATGRESVVFGVYSGGAHCCMQLTAITEVDGRFVVSGIASVDTDIIEPSDIDGDGTMELDLPDDRFNYEFDSYAGSWPPRLVYKAQDGEIVDVSEELRYAPLYERELAATHEMCSGDRAWSYAACAAMLASAARLGRFEDYYVPMAEALRSGAARGEGWGDFETCLNEACSETATLTSFADAVVLKLAEWGYIDWATAVNHAGIPKG